MKLQQQNGYNLNMKAVYYTEGKPLFNKAINYVNQSSKEVKQTPNGARYLEDKSARLTAVLKEKFETIPFIKNLSEENEVFIEYLGEDYGELNSRYNSYATIRVPDYENKTLLQYDIFESHCKNKDLARKKMFFALECEKWFRVTKIANGARQVLVGFGKRNNIEKDTANTFPETTFLTKVSEKLSDMTNALKNRFVRKDVNYENSTAK